ncbi:ABC transporter ATP-binding protein [Micromonospora rifamycinica]|uniref:ABC transporter ATP-binding protein n=1 Tax=Micromonospora rifamycinica TaxID=291594 RepID=UPI002E2C499F|nr:ABC transporter ATP-binding protein [Micromonospora rifamycinica]
MSDRRTLLRVEHLRKVYESPTGDVEAIGDLSFTMDAGELVCIVGPSGCGKTTLLKCLAGLLRPTGGVVEMHGAPVTGPSPAMAVVFQEYGRSLYPWLTVRGNVELPLRHKKLSRAARGTLVADALDAVGLGHAARSHPWQLSGGMQQRVAIARAVAYQPEVLIMDEPFAAVDAQTRADLEDLVRELHARREMSILFVTHDIDESVYLGERVLVLSHAPTRVREDLTVDLPAERDQITTRALPRFTELRTRVYGEIQRAKRGQPADRSAP